jgi:hypothetical protein
MLKVHVRAIWLGVLMLGIAWLESSPALQYQIEYHGEQQETGNAYEKDFAALISPVLIPIGDFIHGYKDEITALSTAIIAAFTVILGIFTISLARSTRKAVETAQAEFVASHRPRLIIREIQCLTSRTRQNIELRYVVANIGDTSAEIVESHIEIQEVPDGMLRPLQPIEGANPIGRRTVAPGRHIFDECSSTVSIMSLVVSRMSDQRRLPKGRADLNENRAVCFRGFVIYIDRNGIQRRTGFCRVYDSKVERFYPLDDPDYEYAD